MDFLPLASITAGRAMRRHFDGGRVDSTVAQERSRSEATVRTHRGATTLRAGLAGLLYRGARAVEPCGHRQPATR